jgi:hypothetical protein
VSFLSSPAAKGLLTIGEVIGFFVLIILVVYLRFDIQEPELLGSPLPLIGQLPALTVAGLQEQLAHLLCFPFAA